MTIASQSRTAGPFTGTGLLVSYPFAFKVFTADDLLIQQTDTSGTITPWVLGANYTVVLNADQNVSPGGTITPLVALPAGYTLMVTSAVTLVQPASLTNAGGFFPKTIEDALDRLTILIQQALGTVGSALRVPEIGGAPALPPASVRAGFLLGFDGSGLPALVAAAAQSATALALSLVSAAGSTFVNFLQAGAGAVLRAVQAELREKVSTKQFGAVADGVTNDAVAVANANTQAAAIGGSLTIQGVHHIGSPITITVPIVDTKAQIFSTASQVTIDNGLTVRPEWWGIGNLNAIALAIAALPASKGGVVQLEDATYKPNGWAYGFAGAASAITKDNVTIRGRRKPRVADDCKSLVGGTIIQGTVLAFANGFEITDCGIDNGYTVLQAYNGGVAAAGGWGEGLELTYPNDATKNAAGLRRGARIERVVSLTLSPTAPVHAVILGEGYTDVFADDVTAVYGTHGIAVKCEGLRAGALAAYLNGSDGVIIKSDLQATAIATNVQIDKIKAYAAGPNGTSPYIGAAGTGYALLLQAAGNSVDKVQIGQVEVRGYPTNVATSFGGPYSISSVTIDQLITDQLGVAGTTQGAQIFAVSSEYINRFRINSMEARNCTVGLQAVFPQTSTDLANHVSVGHLTVVNGGNAVDIGNQAYVDIGTVVTDNLSDAVYHITGTPKLTVGTLVKDTLTPAVYSSASGGLAPALSNGWTQVTGGSDPFGVDLLGGRVFLRGLVKPGTSNLLCTLPQWAWPPSSKRFIVQAYNGTTIVAAPLTVGGDGTVKVNEVAGGFANCSTWLSIEVSWDQQA